MIEKKNTLVIFMLSMIIAVPLTKSGMQTTITLNPDIKSIPQHSSTSSEILVDDIGFEEKTIHTWNLDTVNLQIDLQLNSTHVSELNSELNTDLNESELNTLVDSFVAIPNNLTDSNMDIYVGNFTEYGYYNDSVAWIAPSLITERDITISKDTLDMILPEEQATNFAFTFPRKSGIMLISPIVPIISSTLTVSSSDKTLTSSSTPTNILGNSVQNSMPVSLNGDLQVQSVLSSFMGPPGAAGIPYRYNDLSHGAYVAPVPFTNTTILNETGMNAETQFDSMPSANASYGVEDNIGTFSANGTMSGSSNGEAINVSLDELTSKYNINTGIMQKYGLSCGVNVSDGYGNRINATLDFQLSKTNAQRFDFDVQRGDTLGYTFTKASLGNGLIDAVNETVQGQLESPSDVSLDEDMLEGLLDQTKLEFECLGESVQELGLAYNLTAQILGQENSFQTFISNPFYTNMPYVLPKWERQLSYFQTSAYLLNDFGPNLLNSEFIRKNLSDIDPRFSIDINNDYSVLGTKSNGLLEWVSMNTSLDIHMGYNETTADLAAFDANISGHFWMTYSGSGYLTEIGANLTVDLAYDTTGDNTPNTEGQYPINLSLNRVENDATGNPDYDSSIDPVSTTDTDAWGDMSLADDDTPPTVSFTSPTDGTAVNTTSLTVSWNGTDNTLIDKFSIRIDGNTWNEIGKTTSFDYTNLAEGSHTVEVKAKDAAGNTKSYSMTFTIDQSAPSVSITSPGSGEEVSTSDVRITWTGSDNVSWIDHYAIKIDDGSWNTVENRTSYESQDLSGGTHTVTVKAIDGAGNPNTDSLQFTVNTSPLGGPGMIEEAVLASVSIGIIAILIYVIRKKK